MIAGHLTVCGPLEKYEQASCKRNCTAYKLEINRLLRANKESARSSLTANWVVGAGRSQKGRNIYKFTFLLKTES